jgi:hypothetical protein
VPAVTTPAGSVNNKCPNQCFVRHLGCRQQSQGGSTHTQILLEGAGAAGRECGGTVDDDCWWRWERRGSRAKDDQPTQRDESTHRCSMASSGSVAVRDCGPRSGGRRGPGCAPTAAARPAAAPPPARATRRAGTWTDGARTRLHAPIVPIQNRVRAGSRGKDWG